MFYQGILKRSNCPRKSLHQSMLTNGQGGKPCLLIKQVGFYLLFCFALQFTLGLSLKTTVVSIK